MSIQTVYSIKQDLIENMADLRSQVQMKDVKMVVYFASSKFAPEALSRQMQGLFPQAAVIGCSTAGEIVSGKMLKGAVVAMLLGSDSISDVRIEVLEGIQTENAVPQAFARFGEYYKIPMAQMDHNAYVGIILIDGLSRAEERLMEKIGDLTNVTFIGGSAGDDLQFKQTFVYANGKAYTDAAVLALIKPAVGFDFIKTQSFCALKQKLVATKVDEPQRIVLEFNNKPAVEAYAETLGISIEEAAQHFMDHPVGLMVGKEPYVRSPQQILGDRMRFYCNIKEGMELKVLESTNIVEDTKHAVAAKQQEVGKISGIINFHCILRTLELEQKGLCEAYGNIFADIPTIGFSTYGEEYVGHVNQTSTMLVFK